ISKGGITSFDVLNKGLHMSSARVLGQVAKNIPAVRLEKGSLYPGMSVVVFPGNVGETETLKELVKQTVC
ncbi:MAG: hydroxyacid dehydrogenase, partial [Erysipelotrichaceae bacterium]|nr:hydroxyacid dehydrogenase [Erysipelotrichaceae bacterium]